MFTSSNVNKRTASRKEEEEEVKVEGSGPEDQSNPAQSTLEPSPKRVKESVQAPHKDADGNPYFELDSKKRVTVSKFKGQVYINIREFYTDKTTGQERPGSKGIALNSETWAALKHHMDSIDAALAESNSLLTY